MDVTASRVALLTGLLGLALLCPPAARANLGADRTSIRVDQAQLGGSLTIYNHDLYDEHEITNDSGMVVREFLTHDGSVFAVSWSGPITPDLQWLLGTHYGAYASALKQLKRPGLQRVVRFETDDLVFVNGGHVRAFIGHAYVPSLVPRGVGLSVMPW